MTGHDALIRTRDELRGLIASTAQAGLDEDRYDALFALTLRHWPHAELLGMLTDRDQVFVPGAPGATKWAQAAYCQRMRRIHAARCREHYEHLHGPDSRWATTLSDSLTLQWSALLSLWLTHRGCRAALAALSRTRLDG